MIAASQTSSRVATIALTSAKPLVSSLVSDSTRADHRLFQQRAYMNCLTTYTHMASPKMDICFLKKKTTTVRVKQLRRRYELAGHGVRIGKSTSGNSPGIRVYEASKERDVLQKSTVKVFIPGVFLDTERVLDEEWTVPQRTSSIISHTAFISGDDLGHQRSPN